MRCCGLRRISYDIVLDDDPTACSPWTGSGTLGALTLRWGSLLGNEVGTHLGAVIVKHIPGAAWKVWPTATVLLRQLGPAAGQQCLAVLGGSERRERTIDSVAYPEREPDRRGGLGLHDR